MKKDYQERARERFEQFKKEYEYDSLDEFKWEQTFLLEEQFKDVGDDKTRTRMDILDLIKRLNASEHMHKKRSNSYEYDLLSTSLFKFIITKYSFEEEEPKELFKKDYMLLIGKDFMSQDDLDEINENYKGLRIDIHHDMLYGFILKKI